MLILPPFCIDYCIVSNWVTSSSPRVLNTTELGGRCVPELCQPLTQVDIQMFD